MKECRHCKVTKLAPEFSPAKNTRDGLASWCRRCTLDAGKAWRLRSRDAVNKGHRDKRYRKLYGPNAAEMVQALLEIQGSVCAICGLAERHNTRAGSGTAMALAVDHDKATDEIRGLLCLDCNRNLGRIGDDLAGVMRFVRYLTDPPAKGLTVERAQPTWGKHGYTECRRCGRTDRPHRGYGYCRACHEWHRRNGVPMSAIR